VLVPATSLTVNDPKEAAESRIKLAWLAAFITVTSVVA
jgi:hypothetical protein